MNLRRGWNPNLVESYLPEYSEDEAKNFTRGTSGIYLRSVNFLSLEPFPILKYRKYTKTTSFSILGFSSMKP